MNWQLAGTKKIQQILSNLEILEKYSKNSELIAESFAGLFELSEVSIANALANPDGFVLKPQREGGGNNFYGADLAQQLRKMHRNEWGAYILMELLRTRPIRNVILRNNVENHGFVICELGVYSCLVRHSIFGTTFFNRSLGHLLRTKFSHILESGVSAGFGALDSPLLV